MSLCLQLFKSGIRESCISLYGFCVTEGSYFLPQIWEIPLTLVEKILDNLDIDVLDGSFATLFHVLYSFGT